MKPNMDSLREKLTFAAKRVGKGTRKVAAATTLAVASLSGQAQTPPPIPDIPEVSIQKQDSYNALLPEGSKIGTKAVSGQTPIFYKMQTSPGNYTVDISQWSGLSIPDDAKLKAKIGHFDSFLRSLVLADAEFAKKKTVYIGMSGQARESLKLKIPEGMIDGYKIEIVYLPTTEDDGNKIVVSVIEPDDGKFYEYRGKVFEYENTKSGLMAKLGGKQEVIDAIDSHPLRTIGVVSAETLGVLALGGLAGAGLANRRKKQVVPKMKNNVSEVQFESKVDELLRSHGIDFERGDDRWIRFELNGKRYLLSQSDYPDREWKVTLGTTGFYLTPEGDFIEMRLREGVFAPRVSLDILNQYLSKQAQSGGAPTQPAGEGDMVVLDEAILRHVEIEDLPRASNKLLGTIQRIDELITSAGFTLGTHKLRFLNTAGVGSNEDSRLCKFRYGEKNCEIYVNSQGLVQVVIDSVKTPKEKGVGDLEQSMAVLKEFFES